MIIYEVITWKCRYHFTTLKAAKEFLRSMYPERKFVIRKDTIAFSWCPWQERSYVYTVLTQHTESKTLNLIEWARIRPVPVHKRLKGSVTAEPWRKGCKYDERHGKVKML